MEKIGFIKERGNLRDKSQFKISLIPHVDFYLFIKMKFIPFSPLIDIDFGNYYQK